MDRPGLVDRVFKVKLKPLLADLKSKLFGKCVYLLYVIEYQARGVVHGHIIVKYERAPEQRADWIYLDQFPRAFHR